MRIRSGLIVLSFIAACAALCACSPEGSIGANFDFMYKLRGRLSMARQYNYSNSGLAEGVQLYRRGSYPTALGRFEQLSKREPSDGEVWFWVGSARRKLGRNKEALAAFNKAAGLGFADARMYNRMGTAYMDTGLYDEAIRSYTRATELDPYFSWAFNNLGIVLRSRGRFDEALAAFDRALLLMNYPAAYNNRISTLELMGRYTDLLPIYEEWLRFNPDNADALARKGWALAGLGRLDEAGEALENAMELDPNSLYVHNFRGLARIIMKDYDGALEDFAVVKKHDPKHLWGYKNSATVYAATGRYSEAADEYVNIIRLAYDKAEAMKTRGLYLKFAGDTGGAIEMFDKAIGAAPTFIQAYIEKGLLLNSEGLFQDAYDTYSDALEIEPGNYWLNNNIGFVCTELGRNEEALGYLETAVRLNPKEPIAYSNLGLAYANLGRSDDAKAARSKAAELRGQNG